MNTYNNVHQKWPIYQEFLTHLKPLYVYVYKCSVQGQNGSVIRNVHLSSGPFKWSALYFEHVLWWHKIIYVFYFFPQLNMEQLYIDCRPFSQQ